MKDIYGFDTRSNCFGCGPNEPPDDPDPNACEVCGEREGEFEHPELGWICDHCWPKCWICGKLAVWNSEGPCCEECEKKGAEEEAALMSNFNSREQEKMKTHWNGEPCEARRVVIRVG